MSSAPFFHAPCPSCGAPVELASSASAFAVCGYCRSGLSLEQGALTLIGEISQVLEDYSPLQMGSAGRWKGKSFTVVGRIQMAYPGGYWNEWRVLFDTGKTGWLADSGGQYSMLMPHESPLTLPAFESLRAGQPFSLLGKRLLVVDHREARCSGAQGELPFPLSERWTARVVDLRDHETMVTLDYSGSKPSVFVGESVNLEAMDMQLLRDEVSIAHSAGRIKGKLESLKCPACGATIDSIGGQTSRASCASCGSTLDITGKAAQLIDRANRALSRTQKTALNTGDRGVLQGVSWLVMGVVCKSAQIEGETFRWSEYLLYNIRQGLRWLSFSHEEGWMFSKTLERLPREMSTGACQHNGAEFRRRQTYESLVEEVWGSFNWEIRRGDRTQVVEFETTRGKANTPEGSLLVCETSAHEQVWSLATPLNARGVASAFGKTLPPARAPIAREWLSEQTFRQLWGFGCVAHLVMMFARPTAAGFVFAILAVIALAANKLSEE